MKKYTSVIRAAVTLAAVAVIISLTPQVNAALTTEQANSIKRNKGNQSALLAAAKAIVASATTPEAKTQAAKDIAALVAVEAPRLASVIVGNLAKDNPAAAPVIAAAAAGANPTVAAAVAKSTAAAAPAYQAQIATQVSTAAGPAGGDIAAAVAAGVAASQTETTQNTGINNPADVSTSARKQ